VGNDENKSQLHHHIYALVIFRTTFTILLKSDADRCVCQWMKTMFLITPQPFMVGQKAHLKDPETQQLAREHHEAFR